MIGKLKLYYVIKQKEGGNPLDLTIFTVVNTLQQAYEYIHKALRLENFDHFKAWCELRNMDYKKLDSWNMYRAVVKPQSKFKIKTFTYNKNEIAELFRTFNSCPPIGCSFDTPMETTVMLSKVMEEVLGEQKVSENSK